MPLPLPRFLRCPTSDNTRGRPSDTDSTFQILFNTSQRMSCVQAASHETPPLNAPAGHGSRWQTAKDALSSHAHRDRQEDLFATLTHAVTDRLLLLRFHGQIVVTIWLPELSCRIARPPAPLISVDGLLPCNWPPRLLMSNKTFRPHVSESLARTWGQSWEQLATDGQLKRTNRPGAAHSTFLRASS